jgi:hypothetical protein
MLAKYFPHEAPQYNEDDGSVLISSLLLATDYVIGLTNAAPGGGAIDIAKLCIEAFNETADKGGSDA